MRGTFFHHRQYLENPNGGCVRKYVSNLVFKFHNDPTVNEDHHCIETGLSVCEKKKVLGREEEKTDLKLRESIETCRTCKKVTYYISIYP